jgi:hypothetical protein
VVGGQGKIGCYGYSAPEFKQQLVANLPKLDTAELKAQLMFNDPDLADMPEYLRPIGDPKHREWSDDELRRRLSEVILMPDLVIQPIRADFWRTRVDNRRDAEFLGRGKALMGQGKAKEAFEHLMGALLNMQVGHTCCGIMYLLPRADANLSRQEPAL